MFAIIETGSKQYKVEEGSIIDIEKINVDKNLVEFDNVLLISNGTEVLIGQPSIDGAKVKGEVLNNFKDKKQIVFKFKRKTGYKVTRGHRQEVTTIRIKKIESSLGNTKKESIPEEKTTTQKKETKSSTKTTAQKSSSQKTEKPKTTKTKAKTTKTSKTAKGEK